MVSMTKLFGTLLGVTLIVMAMFTVLSDGANKYNRNVSEDLNNTVDTYQDEFSRMNSLSTKAKNTTEGTSASQTSTSGFNFQNAIATVKILWETIGIVGNMAGEFAHELGIPSYFRIGLITQITLIVTLMFLAAVFGRKVST